MGINLIFVQFKSKMALVLFFEGFFGGRNSGIEVIMDQDVPAFRASLALHGKFSRLLLLSHPVNTSYKVWQ